MKTTGSGSAEEILTINSQTEPVMVQTLTFPLFERAVERGVLGGAKCAHRRLLGTHRKTYDNWADEPIPALRNKTPREAIRSKEGKRDVIELLKSYEKGEARQAKMEQRSPVSFEFLWNDLGLEREEIV